MSSVVLEAFCPSCNETALVRREPVYEGFKKIGEQRLCATCGYTFDDDEVDGAAVSTRPSVFTDADRPRVIELFSEADARNCRHCRHYLINPFTQRCALHEKEVAATDVCVDFEVADPADDPPDEPDPRGGPTDAG